MRSCTVGPAPLGGGVLASVRFLRERWLGPRWFQTWRRTWRAIASHGNSDELLFPFVARHDDSQPGAVISMQKHAVVTVLDVVLAQVDRSVGGIRVTYVTEQAI
jgi:hypothetical protein